MLRKMTLVVTVAVALFLICSCEQDIMKGSSREVVETRGLTVVLKEGVPRSALELSPGDLTTLLMHAPTARGLIAEEDDSGITIGDLYQAAEARLQEYPFSHAFADTVTESDLIETEDGSDYEIRLSEEQLYIIMEDFPDLHTEQAIYDNLDVIMQIYDLQGAYEVVDFVLNSSDEIGATSRGLYTTTTDVNGTTVYTTSNTNFPINEKEVETLLRNPFQIIGYGYATIRARQVERFHTGCMKILGDDQWDAFRHSFWNILIAQNCIFANRGYRINFAKQMTDAHEYGSNTPLSTAMDLHNNQVGRNLYSKHSWGWWIFVSHASESMFEGFVIAKNRQPNIVICSTVDEINKADPNSLVALKYRSLEEIQELINTHGFYY